MFAWINGVMVHPWLDAFFPAITDLHRTPLFGWILSLFILLFLWKGLRWRSFVVLIGAFLCLGAADGFSTQALKKSFERPRPFETIGLHVTQRSKAGHFSFPSNHATNTFAIATYLSYFSPGLGLLLYPIAALVAYSRVYNGVHFPSDVLAGIIIGLIFGLVFSRLFGLVVFKKSTKDNL